jgi:hypothetical protein
MMLKIKNIDLTKNYDISYKDTMNGLQKYNCECIVYTAINIFFIQSPKFSRDSSFEFWDVGFLDFKNHLFFELGQLLTAPFEQESLFFGELMEFLDKIISNKNYLKLFEIFGNLN